MSVADEYGHEDEHDGRRGDDESLSGRADQELMKRDAINILDNISDLAVDERVFLESMTAMPPMGKYLAGARAGWPPDEVDRRLKADPGLAALARGMTDILLDAVEQKVTQRALNGNLTAAGMVLKAKRPDEWGEKREVRVGGNVTVTAGEREAIAEAVKETFQSAEDSSSRRARIAAMRARAIEAHASDE